MKVITGMHRSGTSFASQCLSALGGDFGDPARLIQADKWNQKGYYENIDVVDINNKSVLGTNVDIKYWLHGEESRIARLRNSILSQKWRYFLFPRPDAIHQRGDTLKPKIKEIGETLGDHCFVKDPRFCLTLKSWMNVVSVTSLVFCFRNPSAVARSLRRRESLPLGFGYKFWSYHVENFLQQVPPDVPILLVNFDDFFHEDRQDGAFYRLLEYMGHADKKGLDALKRSLDIKLRTQTDDWRAAPANVRHVYDVLLDAYRSTEGTLTASSLAL